MIGATSDRAAVKSVHIRIASNILFDSDLLMYEGVAASFATGNTGGTVVAGESLPLGQVDLNSRLPMGAVPESRTLVGHMKS